MEKKYLVGLFKEENINVILIKIFTFLIPILKTQKSFTWCMYYIMSYIGYNKEKKEILL